MLPNKLTADRMSGNPHKWPGMKIRSRKSGEVYTVREVLKSGKVVLEKRWVLYNSDVPTLRNIFEAASP